jgi:hypothetical protein
LRAEVEGREREGREEVGEKKIKRGRLGGGGARGRGVVCSYAQFGRFELSPRRSSFPVRRRSHQSIHPSHIIYLSYLSFKSSSKLFAVFEKEYSM